jgi:hypothetical protein
VERSQFELDAAHTLIRKQQGEIQNQQAVLQFFERYARVLVDLSRGRRYPVGVADGPLDGDASQAAHALADFLSELWARQTHDALGGTYAPGPGVTLIKGFDMLNDANVVFDNGQKWPIPTVVKGLVHQPREASK